ncbi:MAG: hypothetical protein ACM3UL_04370 [Ignavibacteria bacterium]
MNSVKRTIASLLIVVFSLLVILPVALPSGTVSAQNIGYTIDKVDQQVQVMYSGHVVILDTVHVSGQVTDGFMIGLPYKYSAAVLKGIAYDDTHAYQLNLGIQLDDQSGFYGATVNFNGNSPSVFTVAFVLSNQLITEQGTSGGILNFPAYPSLAQNVGTCDVSITFPSTPTTVAVAKDDGNVDGDTYTKTNLPAYTNALASATFQVPAGTLKLTTISSLDRQVTIDPTGGVTVSDSYRIINNSTSLLNAFVLTLPLEATNIIVKDQFGTTAANLVTSASGNIQLANATLKSFLSSGQSTVIVAQYNLPIATLQGSSYFLSDFKLFPQTTYFVNQATITFAPPEGATIVTPKAASLDSSSTLTRNTYQDTLTLTKKGLSYVDFLAPQQNTIQLTYNYNPVWVSFRPTFWASLLAAVACITVFFVRRRKPKEETYAEKTERLSVKEHETTISTQQKAVGIKVGQAVTAETIKEFIDAYEDKKQLNAELKSMDIKAQKGKIPRRQYKVQRSAVETRLEGIDRSIERTKEKLRIATGTYEDLVKQLDLAESDLAEAEENIKILERRQGTGEISIETYKRDIVDYQKQKDKAESAINGILLRLREKIR